MDSEQTREELTGEAANGPRTIQRRTVLKGATWSVPIIAAAVAVPAYAASAGEPTVTFVGGPYTSGACDTVPDITVQATTDGTAPAVGEAILITLPEGLTWSDGSTTPRSLTTDAVGRVTLTGIRTSGPLTEGTLLIGAAGVGKSVNGPITITPAPETFHFYNKSTTGAQDGDYTAVPDGSSPLGDGFWLAPNGDLYRDNVVIASGVTGGAAYEFNISGTVTRSAQYTTADGVNHYYNLPYGGGAGSEGIYSNVPSGSTALGYGYWLTPSGDLLLDDGTQVAQNVTNTSAAYILGSSNPAQRSITFTTSDGVHHFYNYRGWTGPAQQGVYTGVPGGSEPLGVGYWLAPNGDLYLDNTVIAQGVTAAQAYEFNVNGAVARSVQYTTADGVNHFYNLQYGSTTPTAGTYTDIAAGAVPLGYGYWRTPDGDLYIDNELIAEDVTDNCLAYILVGTTAFSRSIQYATRSC